MTEETLELVLTSRIDSVAEAAATAAKLVGASGFGDDAAFGIDMAVREAVTNAVLHGNRQDENKTVEVLFKASTAAFEVTVRDHGHGFNPEGVPDPTEPANLLKASGRGILFMRTFMDSVEWVAHDQGGTIVRMTKQRS